MLFSLKHYLVQKKQKSKVLSKILWNFLQVKEELEFKFSLHEMLFE